MKRRPVPWQPWVIVVVVLCVVAIVLLAGALLVWLYIWSQFAKSV
jgi:hypothetical protein